MWSSAAFFGAGFALQLLAVLPEGVDAIELTPCAGSFLSEDSADLSRLVQFSFGLPACALFLMGSIELGRGLTDVRPVWVRTAGPSAFGALRIGGYAIGKEWRLVIASGF
jgi:hypothetical protein